jgi:hypothetical protein
MYPEGDDEYYLPSWKEKIISIGQVNKPKDIAYSDTNDYFIKEDEVALKHEVTGATVKLTDEGYVDIFAGPRVGIRMDPKTNSINFFGETINMITKNMNLITKPNKFIWNGYYFNPELYFESPTERKQTITGTKEYYHMTHEAEPEKRTLKWHSDSWSVRPMIKSDSKRQYSDGMNQLLKDLGLPIE